MPTSQAKKARAKFVQRVFPRILSRTACSGTLGKGKGSENEVAEKCRRFMWGVPRDQCIQFVYGNDSNTNNNGSIVEYACSMFANSMH